MPTCVASCQACSTVEDYSKQLLAAAGEPVTVPFCLLPPEVWAKHCATGCVRVDADDTVDPAVPS